MQPKESFQSLFRWQCVLPVMAMLLERKGEKLVTLYRTLGVSEGAVRGALSELIERGWVMKNPGYGHPMRPEYVLTDNGRAVAEKCHELLAFLQEHGFLDVARSKWTMVIVLALGRRPLRYHELLRTLVAVTDRSLVLSLKSLAECRLVERTVRDSFPPAVTYSLSTRGIELLKPLRALAVVV